MYLLNLLLRFDEAEMSGPGCFMKDGSKTTENETEENRKEHPSLHHFLVNSAPNCKRIYQTNSIDTL